MLTPLKLIGLVKKGKGKKTVLNPIIQKFSKIVQKILNFLNGDYLNRSNVS